MVVWVHHVNKSHVHCVDRVLVPYAQEIADADEDAIPLYSWGFNGSCMHISWTLQGITAK